MIWGTPIYGNLHIVLVLIPCQGEYSQTEQSSKVTLQRLRDQGLKNLQVLLPHLIRDHHLDRRRAASVLSFSTANVLSEAGVASPRYPSTMLRKASFPLTTLMSLIGMLHVWNLFIYIYTIS